MATTLTFQRRPTKEWTPRFTVAFARGGVIECSTAARADDLARRHQQRGALYGVHDPVVSSVWHDPGRGETAG